MTRRIAVVGAGAAGLTSAWLLSRHFDVTLFEAEGRLGGHANTVEVPLGGRSVPVDTGFIVYNEATYPNLIALFAELGVATEPSDMSFAVSLDGGRLEYAGQDSLGPLFAQRRNLVRPRFLAMLAGLLRFYREADAADPDAHAGITLAEYLERGRYGRAFRDDHLLPMAAAIWSGLPEEMLAFPAASFLRFFQNHGLLKLSGRPRWRTVTGGSREYVRRIADSLGPRRVRAGTPVAAVRRAEGGAQLLFWDGRVERFDSVVLATHAPQALALLADADATERSVLGDFRTQANHAVLHRDPALMPRRRAAWSSWNYMGVPDRAGARRVSVTYWMNRLQNLDPAHPLFVTLNPLVEPRRDLVLARFDYAHPRFDAAAVAAQGRLGEIQGARRVWFCGAWQRYGFHEDAVMSAVRVAAALGAPAPWTAEAAMARAA